MKALKQNINKSAKLTQNMAVTKHQGFGKFNGTL